MKYLVIADENTVKGFSSLGLEGFAVDSSVPTQVQQAFEKALSLENLGALLLSSSVANTIRPQVAAHQNSCNFPQILVFK